jgi:hypothetical protein
MVQCDLAFPYVSLQQAYSGREPGSLYHIALYLLFAQNQVAARPSGYLTAWAKKSLNPAASTRRWMVSMSVV